MNRMLFLIALFLVGSGPAEAQASISLFEVTAIWDAPIGSPDPVAGYNVFRSIDGVTFQQINGALITATTENDLGVIAGQTCQYYVTSVDATGVQSVPSNTITLPIGPATPSKPTVTINP